MSLVPSPVRVIGTGLIGCSLGMALMGTGVRVQVEDASPGTTALAVEMGVGSRPGPDDPDPALVLVAAPPDVTAQFVARALTTGPRAIVADVASVKKTVLDAVRESVDEELLTHLYGTSIEVVHTPQGELYMRSV